MAEERKEKLTQTEWLKKYLIEPDDEPEELNEVFWSVTSRTLNSSTSPITRSLNVTAGKSGILSGQRSGAAGEGGSSTTGRRGSSNSTPATSYCLSLWTEERELQATEIKELRTSDNENPPSKGIRATLGKIFGGG